MYACMCTNKHCGGARDGFAGAEVIHGYSFEYIHIYVYVYRSI